MRGCLSIDAPVWNKVGKSMERSPSVLYSLIGEISIGGQSIEGASGVFGIYKKCLISSTSVLALGCVQINEFGGSTVEDKLCWWDNVSLLLTCGIQGEMSVETRGSEDNAIKLTYTSL